MRDTAPRNEKSFSKSLSNSVYRSRSKHEAGMERQLDCAMPALSRTTYSANHQASFAGLLILQVVAKGPVLLSPSGIAESACPAGRAAKRGVGRQNPE